MENKIRILHIDDNVHDRFLVKDALMHEGGNFEISEAANRKIFEKLLSEREFDVILSDFNILGFDGLQVLEYVREKKTDLPVIIVTGTGSEEVAIKAMKMGAADYVIKTVNHIRGLAPAIKSVLLHKQIQTERNNALIALNESEKLFRTAFENAAVGVCLLDLEGRFISVNNTLSEILGYTKEELEKMNISGVSHPDDMSIGMTYLKQLIDGKTHSVIIEKRYIHKKGHVIWVCVSTGIFYGGKDKSGYFVTYILDITERRNFENQLKIAKEKAEESDRLKTAFLNNISHEIRTPLNAIVGFSTLQNKPNLTSEQRSKYNDMILQSSDKLLSIISDIIRIATLEAGQVIIELKEVNINKTLDLLLEQFNIQAQKKNIELRFNKSTGDDLFVKTDETKLNQIIANLLGNSLKYTAKGKIEFGYRIKKDLLEFYVKDTGIGIPEDMYDEIFKRFRQVETTAARNYGGSGLGLSITKAYVELLGGKIWLESTMGKGTIFFFTISLNQTDNKAKTVAEKPVFKESSELKNRKNILIAEDEDSNYLFIEACLSDYEMVLSRATNGIEAVEICKTHPEIDLVLMDIKMPVMNGLDATKQIKLLRPDLHVIAQSAYSTESEINKSIECGCDDFISKPINFDLLISKINKHLVK